MARPHPDPNLDLHDPQAYGAGLAHNDAVTAARRSDRRNRVSKSRQEDRPPTVGRANSPGEEASDLATTESAAIVIESESEIAMNAGPNLVPGVAPDLQDSSEQGSKRQVRHALNPVETQSQGYGDARSRDPARHPPHPHSANGFDTRVIETEEAVHLKIIENLQVQLASANSNIETLKNEIRAKEEAGALLKRRNNAMQSSRDAQEELLGRQDEDQSIESTFEGLFHQVKNWTGKYCNTASSEMVVTGVHQENLARIQRVLPSLTDVGDLPDFLPVGALRRRRQFVRGYLGLVLAETLIRSLPGTSHPTGAGQDYWLPVKVCDGVRELESTLLGSGGAITLTAFHQWRTITMSLLAKVHPPSRWSQSQDTMNFIEDQVDLTLSIIRPLGSHPDDSEQRKKLMDNIFIPAIEFSQFLRRQRACWSVRFPNLAPTSAVPPSESVAHLFDRATMEDRDSLADDDLEDASSDQCLKSVEIVVTPVLFKSGNHDGIKYDVVSPVRKAEVSCAEIRIK
ncbi:hypothetical protein AK830_g7312 [Neonectria ditissima]|uniref:Uncharacterized protein n=1 Tax=Neonectria ditissima TaxID=78410 RepID=A0A0P7BAG5_9HYPO|nr:hypothetical protein AK830_g7312 [Neonectria ditissima]